MKNLESFGNLGKIWRVLENCYRMDFGWVFRRFFGRVGVGVIFEIGFIVSVGLVESE
jgi:hypothetical protein